MNEELLYTQEDIDEWIKTCEELQEKVKEQEETIKQLSEYKRLEEQGLIVRLPCKVGDNVYYIKDYGFKRYRIEEMGVVGFNFPCYGDTITVVGRYGEIAYVVYKTKAEAEKKLAELKGENNGSN